MIYHPKTPQEAVNLRKEHADTAVYLAGGTDDLRLGGAAEGKDLIDITGFDFNTITEKDGKVYIGALSLIPFAMQPLMPRLGSPCRNAPRSFSMSLTFFLLMARRSISACPSV